MKRFTPVLAALTLAASLAGPATAQDRIGFANLEVILAYMPDAKTVNDQLDSYQRELGKQLETKQSYAQQKFAEYQDAKSAGVASEAKITEMETELQRLDREIRQAAQNADEKMLTRRNELMEPIVEKLQKTIEIVAKAEGYTVVVNGVDGAGTSIVLYGPEDRDLTKKILQEMGVQVPESGEAPKK
ncbi:MAG: OmpH family outer membrane protein [bacterium]